MEISVVNQFAGRNTIATELEALLRKQRYRRLRVLMAFCRGTGLGLLMRPLSEFLQRGGKLHAILGLDLGGTSPEALDTLLDLGAELFVFGVEGDRTFHPKVYLFDDAKKDSYGALIGSGNLTVGGLDSNFEAAIRMELRTSRSSRERSVANELEQLWRTYRRPKEPMERDNLRRVSRELIQRIAHELPAERQRTPDERARGVGDRLFPPISAPRRTRVRPARRPIKRQPTKRKPAGLPTTLYLEVTGPETGQLREIQVPVDSLQDYFGIEREDTLYMTFKHPDGSTEKNRRLAIYDRNTTFRISSAKFKEVPVSQRPMIVKLERTREDTFAITLIRSSDAKFAEAQNRLDRGGGNSKRWGTEP